MSQRSGVGSAVKSASSLNASDRACTRPTPVSPHIHSHSPSAQAHFVPELTVQGIASESKFVHHFSMAYSTCVSATLSAWIASEFSRRLIFHVISNPYLISRQRDAVGVLLGSFDILGQLLAVCDGDVAWRHAILMVLFDDLRLDVLLCVRTGVGGTRIEVDGCLLWLLLEFVAMPCLHRRSIVLSVGLACFVSCLGD